MLFNCLEFGSSEKEYYGQSAHFADGEEPSKFMKENNDFTKISEIQDPELQKIYIDKAIQMNKLDPNDPDIYNKVKNIDIVLPKENSQLYNQIKNSEVTKRKVAEIYRNIGNNKETEMTVEYPKSFDSAEAKRSLYTTLHLADLKKPTINKDGSFNVLMSDGYDFSGLPRKHFSNSHSLSDLWNIFINNKAVNINNRAVKQQKAEQIRNYLLSMPINYTKEEIEEILKNY